MTTNQETLGKLRFFNFVQWCPSYPTIRTGPFKKIDPGFFFRSQCPLLPSFLKIYFLLSCQTPLSSQIFNKICPDSSSSQGSPTITRVLVRLYRIFRSRTDAVLEHPSTLVGKPFDPEQTSKPRYKNLVGPSQ